MKKTSKPLYLIGLTLLLILTACSQQRMSSENPPGTPEISPTTTPIPTPSLLDLDPTVQRTLRNYPLRVGSTWVYEYLGYDAKQEIIWRVTETIVDASLVDGYYVAKMERTAELLDGDPPANFINTPDTGVFWFLVDGEKIYQFSGSLDTELSNAWLSLIIPFPAPDDGWYPDPAKRGAFGPGEDGYRFASEPYVENVAGNNALTCYNVKTLSEKSSDRRTFCETIGFFYFEFINYDQPSGHRVELKGFSVQ